MIGDLDDAACCPLGSLCESCGAVSGLAVAVFDVAPGVLCVTLCGSCARDRALPLWLHFAGAGRVSHHAGHVDRPRARGAQAARSEG